MRVAVRPSAARRHAARAPRARRSTSTTSASRPTPRRLDVQEGLLVRPGLERLGLLEEHRRRREGSSVHRHQLRLGARARARRQDEHLGPARAAALRLRLQGEEPRRLRRGLADLLRGHRAVLRPRRSVSRHLRRQGRTCRTCPTASSSGRHKLNARRGHAAQLAEEDGPRRSRRIAPASRPTA